MMVQSGAWYSGIRFYNENQETIVDYSWTTEGEWTPLQEIPADQQIIGLKCNTESSPDYLYHLSFILGKKGEAKIAGELRFPVMNVYPNRQDYEILSKNGDFQQLSSINYKSGGYSLAGIQFIFSENTQCPLFQTPESESTIEQTIDLDTSKTVKYVSMNVYGSYYAGLRLLDDKGEYIVDF